MFQIINVQGAHRALVPGELASRKRVQPIARAASVSDSRNVASPDLGVSTHGPQNRQAALVARYESALSPQEPQEILFVREIMTTEVTTVQPTCSVREVALLLRDHRYRHVPIVSMDGGIVGLLSDRDVLKYQTSSKQRENTEELVSRIMVSEVLVATTDTLIRDAARTRFEERIGCLPIVDERSWLVGIVTRSDIMRALIIHGPIRLWA